MEKIPAANAMEWSIHLEKGLRSSNPTQAIECISEAGQRLQKLTREPELTMAARNVFGLIPDEDGLFINTIRLRLAETFKLGDNQTRRNIARVLLSQYKSNVGQYWRHRVDNQPELLSRIKLAFDTGDTESRAYSLTLLGCWAYFAKDSAEIRYMILLSLVSSDVLEVKASLFAGGCLSELSDDFACVFLEMLIILVTSSKSSSIRQAGVRALSKLDCSSSVATRAYKKGVKLLEHSSDEEFVVSMLISLSKLASKSILLVSEQVTLLLPFLTQAATSRVQATVLRCLHYILTGRVSLISVGESLINILCSMLDDSKLSSTSQHEALQILHKILLYTTTSKHCMDNLELSTSLTAIEKVTKSTSVAMRLLAIHILVDFSGYLELSLLTRVTSSIIDRFIFLLKQVLVVKQMDTEVNQEARSLLKQLLPLVEKHPNLGDLVLEKLFPSIEALVNEHESTIQTTENGIVEVEGERGISVTPNLMFYIFKFVASLLENTVKVGTDAAKIQVFQVVKYLVELVQRCKLFCGYTRIVSSLVLGSCIDWDSFVNCDEDKGDLVNLGDSFQEYSRDQETFTLKCANEMLERKDYWAAYKVGRSAACNGAWFMGSFIFADLIKRAQSVSSRCWLKSLAQFAHSERKIQQLLSKNGPNLLFLSKINNIGSENNLCKNINSNDYREELGGVCIGIFASEKTLGASVCKETQYLSFQRWFLVLRANVLEITVDLLKILHEIPFQNDEPNTLVSLPRLVQQINSSLNSLTLISSRLKRASRGYDLLVTSFIDMDNTSSRIISALALSCSVLAFITGFSLLIPNLPGLQSCSHSLLIQNLLERLAHIDHETSKNLNLLFTVVGKSETCFCLQSKNQNLGIGCETREVLKVCKCAVTEIVRMQTESNGVHTKEVLLKITKNRMEFVLDVLKRWMLITFRTPNRFFHVRPCFGPELFVFNADPKNRDRLSVLPGCHLSLSICLQLKNKPPNFPVELTKLYCILFSRPSFQIPKSSGENENTQQRYGDSESEEMADMNEKILQYIMKLKEEPITNPHKDSNANHGVVTSCMRFEPNDSGQGFSNCLLDVSNFPAGTYQIKWYSGCIDNHGSYWSLIPLNSGPLFTVERSNGM